MPEPDQGEQLSSDILGPGYNQTYVIRAASPEGRGEGKREVLFKCGNWCYEGFVDFSESIEGVDSIPYIIPELQRQQDRLGFYCSASNIPEESVYHGPLAFLQQACDFIAAELASDKIVAELDKWSSVFSWMDEEGSSASSKTYFELITEAPRCMGPIAAAASKTYARGLVLVLLYFEGALYVVVEDGEGDQPLLDIRFPDVSQHGQGLHLASYPDVSQPWRKLTLWQSLAKDTSPLRVPVRESSVADLSSTDYLQTYIVLKPKAPHRPDAMRDVMFRFGSWCYSGRVQLTPMIGLSDIPHVIPVLRMQQSQLDFTCDVTAVPRRSPFMAPMDKMMKLGPTLEEEVIGSEAVLANLVKRLSLMGFGENISEWLDGGDSNGTFFEFQTAPLPEGEDPFAHVDVMASKNYNPQGIVTVSVYYRGVYYVVVSDGATEQPLLDSRFPNVSDKGRGYQLKSYPDGRDTFKELRKVSIWQTAASLKSQSDRAEAKLMELKAAKGTDAMEAAQANYHYMDTLTNEALRSSPSTEAEDKAPPSSKLKPQPSSSSSSSKLQPPTSTAGYRSSPLSMASSPKTPMASGAGGEGSNSKQTEEGGGGEEGDVIVRKNANFSAAKPLGMSTKVALPHHLEPLQVGGALRDRMKALQSELGSGGGGGEAPWDARGKPLPGLGQPLFKK